MIASKLNVYIDTFHFVGKLMDAQAQFSKMYKYTLGARMQESAVELFGYIQMANMFRENRVKYLNGFIVKFESVKTLLRLACDRKQVSIRRQAEIFQLMEAISRQITAWKNSPCKRTKQASAGTTPNGAEG